MRIPSGKPNDPSPETYPAAAKATVVAQEIRGIAIRNNVREMPFTCPDLLNDCCQTGM